MHKKLKEIKQFCTEVKTKYPPQTKKEWQICMDAHGCDKLDISIELFQQMAKSLNSKILITNTQKTPFAFFINMKNKFTKSSPPSTVK